MRAVWVNQNGNGAFTPKANFSLKLNISNFREWSVMRVFPLTLYVTFLRKNCIRFRSERTKL